MNQTAIHPGIQQVFDQLRGIPCVVAGGAAADFDRAQDIDVFFLSQRDFEQACRQFPVVEVKEYAPFTVVRVSMTAQKPVSFVIHPELTTAQALVDQFDISTHAIAIAEDGTVIRGKFWTPPSATPVITRVFGTPEETAMRYIRVCERYGHQVEGTELRKLVCDIDTEIDF